MMWVLHERFPVHFIVFKQTACHLSHEANVEQMFSRMISLPRASQKLWEASGSSWEASGSSWQILIENTFYMKVVKLSSPKVILVLALLPMLEW